MTRLQRADAQAWTVSDLPLLDAARQRLGDPEASRRQRRQDAAVAAEREQMARVVDHLIADRRRRDGSADVDAARRGPPGRPGRRGRACPPPTPDLLAGPFAHIVVDEAQELTDAEWQMLLRRCPSRSFTIVGDRAQARHGFPSRGRSGWNRPGSTEVRLASLTINYRTPEEVMAEAEPVIRAVLPDANVPTSIRHSGVPVVHGAAADLDASSRAGSPSTPRASPASSATPAFAADAARVQSLTPELAKGLEFDLVVLVDPERSAPASRARSTATSR